ncbi:MAG: hypothetical protein KBF88_11510, partial [Polyangiaceae bacterium]|nr:hypothetical protein [Polyangiaceae bacterium]
PLPPHVAAQAAPSSPPESGRMRSSDSGSMRATTSNPSLKADSEKVPSQPPSSASGEMQTSKISVRPPPSAPMPPRSTPAPALPPPSNAAASEANASAPAPTESAPAAIVSSPELLSSPELADDSAPAPAPTKPGAGDAEKTLQMEWDDDDEATHVLDKTSEDVRPLPKDAVPPPPSGAAPASGRIAPPATQSYSKLQAVKPPPPPPPPPTGGTIPPGPQLPPAASAAPPPQVALPSASASAPPPPPNTMPGGFGNGVTGPAKSLVSAVNAPPPPPPPPAAMHQPIGASQPPPPPPGARPVASLPPYSANAGPMPVIPPAGPVGVSAPAATVPTGSIPPRPVQPDQVHTEPLSLPERLPQAPSRTEATQLVRSPRRSQLPYVIAGAAALLLGATVWWSIPKTGKLLVNVVNEKGNNVDRVEVLVDGNQKCVDSPCKVVDLTADTHQVKARLGSNSVVQEVRIEAGEEKKISVTLNGAAAATTTPVAPTKTGVKVANAQPGVHLFVDGKDLGAIGGPKEFILGAGDHKIRLDAPEKAGRYEALEKNVAVVDGNLFDLSSLQLRVLKGEVTLVNKTQGAKIMFVSGSERRVVPDDPKKTFPKTYGPLTIDAKDGKSWTIEATKAGYQDFSQVVSFADGNPEKTIEIDLASKTQEKPAVGEKPTGKSTKTTVAATTPAGTDTPGGDEKPDTTPKPKATATESAPKGDAKLTMNSLPSSNIILDGKSIGTTPKVGYPVSAGEHTITFNNAEQSLKKTTQVNVSAGDTKVVVMKLRD